MIYKSGPMTPKKEAGPAYWFLFYGEELLASVDNGKGSNEIPYFDDMKYVLPLVSEFRYFGTIDGKDSYFGVLSENTAVQGYLLAGLRQLSGRVEDEWYWLANRAYHLIGWSKKNRFCGCCGGPMHDSPDEVAFICGKCGNTVYPRISPAVIVAITKGDRILLAHASKFKGQMYSVIAGFVEPGETLEECVRREVTEEVGLHVKNIRYFASQPWPYPDSLMVAFTAEYESGEISIDNKEIADAGWYSRDSLPELPSRASVAKKLIDAWLNR